MQIRGVELGIQTPTRAGYSFRLHKPPPTPAGLKARPRHHRRLLGVVYSSSSFPPQDEDTDKDKRTAEHHDKLKGAHKPIGLVAMSAYILSSATQLSGVPATDSPAWLPIVAGGALGALFIALNRAGVHHTWQAPKEPLNVVITGSSRGIGKALAREFLKCGDTVLVTSRSQRDADAAVAALLEEAGLPSNNGAAVGVACDVSDPESIEALKNAVAERLGRVDVWINNAGYSGSFQSLLSQDAATIENVVRTNLVGSILCTRAAMQLMASQPGGGGHVFNLEGAGSDGSATPRYAAYGATKAGIAQLCHSLQHELKINKETKQRMNDVGVHNLSPGMVLTDLLLDGATPETKRVFNILCEHPETVAAFLVPRARTVAARGLTNQRIRYLTPMSAMGRFLSAPFRIGRFFDSEGKAFYPREQERLSGQHAKRTQRHARIAAARSAGLGLAYGASIAAAYLILVAEQVANAHSGGP